MSTAPLQPVNCDDHLIAEHPLVYGRNYVAARNNRVAFCEDCVMEDGMTLTNVGLEISLDDWRKLLAQLDQTGHAEDTNVSLEKLSNGQIAINWTTRQNTILLDNFYATGRFLSVVANCREDLAV